MTMQILTPASTFTVHAKATTWLVTLRKSVSMHYQAWKAERARKANLRFVMRLDPIILRDLGFTRDELAARHDGPLPISRWKSQKPID
jgi:hypothetical protein